AQRTRFDLSPMNFSYARNKGRRRRLTTLLWLSLAGPLALGLGGCSPQSGLAPLLATDEAVPPDALVVPGNRNWGDSWVDVGGGPAANCSVVVFYIDGLRPDVVEEMAAMDHIPNLKKHFVEGGSHLCNAFTAFPSDTITSNGTMWTGCFSDRHGVKCQVRFSR